MKKPKPVITCIEMSNLGKDPTPTTTTQEKKLLMLSDETKIGENTWAELKTSAMGKNFQ